MTDKEIQSGWKRTGVTSLIGILALAGSTYTIVSKITRFELSQEINSKRLTALEEEVVKKFEREIDDLKKKELPAGLALGRVEESINSIRSTLHNIERRIERIDKRKDNG